MCIQKIIHTLHCDVRPLSTFTDPSRPLVNPWAIPPPCSCTEPLSPFCRCTYGHKCCLMTMTYLPCSSPLSCLVPLLYHVYRRSKMVEDETPFESFDLMLADRRVDPDDRVYGSSEEGWAPLPVIDSRVATWAEGTPTPVVGADFVVARQAYLDYATVSYAYLSKVREVREQLAVVRESSSADGSYDCGVFGRETDLIGHIFRLEGQSKNILQEAYSWCRVLVELYTDQEGECWIQELDGWGEENSELARCYDQSDWEEKKERRK